jgi:hypothetical protein
MVSFRARGFISSQIVVNDQGRSQGFGGEDGLHQQPMDGWLAAWKGHYRVIERETGELESK